MLGYIEGEIFDRFRRLYALAKNCFQTVAEMYPLGCTIGGDA